MTSEVKLTEAHRVLTKIVEGGEAGVSLIGAELTTAQGMRAWGWCEERRDIRLRCWRYFPTDAGRTALVADTALGLAQAQEGGK